MDLLLTHAYFLGEDEHEQRIMKPYPPLGLLYLCAYLEQRGFAVAVHDTTFGTRRDLWRRLEGAEAPVLGVYTNLMTRATTLAIIAKARAEGWTVVLGGPEAASWPERYLEAGADMIVIGEGELTLAELLPALATRRDPDLSGIRGLAFLDASGAFRCTEPRPAIRDLDTLPWPDREAIDLRAYLSCWREHHGRGSINLITARGCPYRCRWCSHAVFGYGHHRRSPEDVADEVAALRERYDPDMLWVADDVFTISARWLGSFEQIMRRRGLAMPFECITRADRVDAETAERLRRLGAFRVWLGSESGSQRILDAMERGVTTTQVRQATRLLQDEGIAVGLFVMWGYEGEEPSDIEATIEHVGRTVPDHVLTTVAYPIEGTPYADEVRPRIVSATSWADGSDRDRRIAGRHSRQYYDFASRRLRAELELARVRRADDRSLGAGVPAAWRRAQAQLGMQRSAHEVDAPMGQ